MAIIKYNGRLIEKIYKGQRITIHTKGHELEGDIEIEGFDGDAAPNFTTEVVTATPSKEMQTIGPSKSDFISQAIVKPIPDEYVIPSGSVTITSNGKHNVSGKATVNVNVPVRELKKIDIEGIREDEYKSAVVTLPPNFDGKIILIEGRLETNGRHTSDGQYHEVEVNFYIPFENGADAVFGSRVVDGIICEKATELIETIRVMVSGRYTGIIEFYLYDSNSFYGYEPVQIARLSVYYF